MNLKISDKDMPLLYVVVGVVILALAFFVGYKPLDSKAKEASEEIKVLQDRYDDLNSKYQNKEKLEKDKAMYENVIAHFQGKFKQDYLQEDRIMAMVEFESSGKNKETVEVTQINMALPTDGYEFGQINSIDPSKGKAGLNANVKALSTSYNLNMVASYADAKNFMTYMNIGHDHGRNVLTNASMTFDKAKNKVMLNLTYQNYAIQTPDGEFDGKKPKKPVGDVGVKNIFMNEK